MTTPDCTPLKTCCRCGNEYPRTLEYFESKPSNSDGLRGACRLCEKKRKQQRYQQNKELYRQQNRAWIAENRERKNEHSRRDYRKNIDARRETRTKWRAKSGQIKHQNYLDFKRKFPNVLKERRRQYHLNNPHKTVEQARRRRARLKNAIGEFTHEDVRKQYEWQCGFCWWCGEFVGDKYHVDHYIPLVRGGNNTPENIVIACSSCNSSRQDKLPEEWEGRSLWFKNRI